MATIAEVEKLAFNLPDSDRAVLAAHLLRSLPALLDDPDEGIAEALRRDAAHPEDGMTLEQIDRQNALYITLEAADAFRAEAPRGSWKSDVER